MTNLQLADLAAFIAILDAHPFGALMLVVLVGLGLMLARVLKGKP